MTDDTLPGILLGNIEDLGAAQLDWWSKSADEAMLIRIAGAKRLGKAAKERLLNHASAKVAAEAARRSDIPDAEKFAAMLRILKGVEHGDADEKNELVTEAERIQRTLRDRSQLSQFEEEPGVYQYAILSGSLKYQNSKLHAKAVNWCAKQFLEGKTPVTWLKFHQSLEELRNRDQIRDQVEVAVLAKVISQNLPEVAASLVVRTSDWTELWEAVIDECPEESRGLIVKLNQAAASKNVVFAESRKETLQKWTEEEAAKAGKEIKIETPLGETIAKLENWDEAGSAQDLVGIFATPTYPRTGDRELWEALRGNGKSITWILDTGYTVAKISKTLPSYLSTWSGQLLENQPELRGKIDELMHSDTGADDSLRRTNLKDAGGLLNSAAWAAHYRTGADIDDFRTWAYPVWLELMDAEVRMPDVFRCEVRMPDVFRCMLNGFAAAANPGSVPVPLLTYTTEPTPTGKWLAVELAKLGKTGGPAVYVAANSYVGTFPGTAQELVDVVKESIEEAKGKKDAKPVRKQTRKPRAKKEQSPGAAAAGISG